MAFLYRRDLELLGYNIEPRKIKKERLLSVVAYADLCTREQVIPCLATFFRIRKGVRIDYILDENIEYQIMDYYISFMRKSSKLFMELLMRTIIKILSNICGLFAYAYLVYILFTSSNAITIVEFNKMVDLVICIILVMINRGLLNII